MTLIKPGCFVLNVNKRSKRYKQIGVVVNSGLQVKYADNKTITYYNDDTFKIIGNPFEKNSVVKYCGKKYTVKENCWTSMVFLSNGESHRYASSLNVFLQNWNVEYV